MANAVVSYAVQKLGDFLIQEAVVRLRIRDEVEWLRNELGYMQSFIKDAEAKQSRDHQAQQWISEITNLANDTVDILQDFNMIDEASKNGGIVDRVKRYACICIKEANLQDIGKEIQSLKQKVVDLTRKRETYGITVSISDAGEGPSDRSSMVRILRRTTSYAEEEHFVGFEDATKTLLKQLVKAEDRRCVISICGMGGSGKTTLARKLYNSVDIQNRFACRAWICVSQEYSIQNLLRTIAKSFNRGCSTKEELEMVEKMNEEDLELYLPEFLELRRYLVVVDDVCSKEAWESLKRAFPDCQNGSRVIITTRKKDVVERVDGRSFVHHIRFLREEESWDLFEKKISHRDGHAHWFSPAMQEMGKEMVGKCGGLPLAIVVLGGLLSNKKQVEEWHKVKEQLWEHMKNDSIEISHLLSLSYNDLSGSLKQCFLYAGIFPEDYEFSAEKLMWLWMAEEFIPQGNRTEDIVEDYLDELINRNLIQVARRFWGRIARCRIHDLLRDLVVEKAMKVNLFDIYDPHVYSNSGAPLRRRYAIHIDIEKFISVGISMTKLRSLVLFDTKSKRVHTGSLTIITQRFKYLCVLDLENVSFHGFNPQIPDAIGDLIHLKFLGLLRTEFTRLPPNVGNLKSLQTLEISVIWSRPIKMPMEISKLTNLRHLYIHRSDGLLKIDTLTNLRTLKGVLLYQWMHIDTVNLINLRELVLVCIEPSRIGNAAYSLDSISNLKSLTTLILQSSTTIPSLEPLASCPQLLKLWVDGPIENLPPFNKLPHSLAVLKLKGSRLKKDPMPTLEKLLNLRSLEMDRAYLGKEITCSNNGFQKLEYLQLRGAPDLQNWRCEESAMPVIKSLSIVDCQMLKTVPERFKSIPHYEQLDRTETTVGYRLPFPLGEL